ncbi:hypothetical protein [Vibrio parahaemolyticus]|uniref:hypothetical protein n=1 Tax=Vibrio parahaemolyticus TaxID=670 RepID=UPI0023EB15F2|nr:hypothetical protein [Vibrio parahaemolyticus]
MNKTDKPKKTWEDDRKEFFQLANEAGMVEDLAQFAKAFGRFQGASIELRDGRSASYQVPSNIRMKPIENQTEQPKNGALQAPSPQHTHPTNQSGYARFRNK